MTNHKRSEGGSVILDHWDRIFTRTPLQSTGWYESDPSLSLELASRCSLAPDDGVVDAGCGASYFVERMLEQGHRHLVAIDISEVALRMLEERLGAGAAHVRFVRGDLGGPLEASELRDVALWHDRAALHFLIEESQRAAYARTVDAAVRSGGFVILATFAGLEPPLGGLGGGDASATGSPEVRVEATPTASATVTAVTGRWGVDDTGYSEPVPTTLAGGRERLVSSWPHVPIEVGDPRLDGEVVLVETLDDYPGVRYAVTDLRLETAEGAWQAEPSPASWVRAGRATSAGPSGSVGTATRA